MSSCCGSGCGGCKSKKHVTATNSSWDTVMENHGLNYKWGTLFFPSRLREEVYLLYAFVRTADNYVDNKEISPEKARKKINSMQMAFHDFFGNKLHVETSNAATLSTKLIEQDMRLVQEFAKLCKEKEISIDRVDAFFKAMLADTTKSFYKTYEELKEYMYGSAEVIGLMMCKLIGYNKDFESKVFDAACKLGEAMQYTNFLRDIKEDWLQYNRIYIPEKSLEQFDCNHTILKSFTVGTPINKARKKWMSSQITQTKNLFHKANEGIKFLDPQGRYPVRLGSYIYEKILDNIIYYDYDVFSYDTNTTKTQKVLSVVSARF